MAGPQGPGCSLAPTFEVCLAHPTLRKVPGQLETERLLIRCLVRAGYTLERTICGIRGSMPLSGDSPMWSTWKAVPDAGEERKQ